MSTPSCVSFWGGGAEEDTERIPVSSNGKSIELELQEKKSMDETILMYTNAWKFQSTEAIHQQAEFGN